MFKKTISLMLALVLIFTSVPSIVLASNPNDGHLIALEQLLEEIRQEAILAEQEIAQVSTYVFDQTSAEAQAEAERLIAEIEAIAAAVDAVAHGSDFVPTAVPFGVMPLSDPWDGSGTVSDPFLIRTADDLMELSRISWVYRDRHFRLVNSITLEWTGTPWSPIGMDFFTPFTGSFDGGGNTISGLVFTSTGIEENFGFFGRTYGAHISNLTLADVDIVAGEHSGALIGFAEETVIENVIVSGTMVFQEPIGGGIVGILTNNSTISNARFTGNINSSFGVVGGIAGIVSNSSVIDNATVLAGITGAGANIGGVVGIANSNGSVINSDFDGSVTGLGSTGGIIGGGANMGDIRINRVWGEISGTNPVGGVVGIAGISTLATGHRVISRNLNRATVSGNSEVGGIIGIKSHPGASLPAIWVMENANHGNISAERMVGGLIGQSLGPVTIANSYNVGNVAATNGNVAGGAVGSMTSTWAAEAHLIRTYNAGIITTTTGFPGAIAGINGGTITQTWMLVREASDRAIGTMAGIFLGTIRFTPEQMPTLNGFISPPFILDDGVVRFNNGLPILNGLDYSPREGGATDPTTREVRFNDNLSTTPSIVRIENVPVGQQIGENRLQPITRPGYNFLGWFDEEIGGNMVMPATVINDNVTFWARWGQDARIEERGIYLYRIRNADGFYIATTADGILVQNSTRDNTRGTDLWSIDALRDWSLDEFYTIESLGFPHEDRVSLNLLTGIGSSDSTTGQLFLSAPTGSTNQHWRIQQVGAAGNYYFINRANPQLMIRAGANHTVDLAAQSQNATWGLVRYDTTSYLHGRYTGHLHNGVATVGIGVTDSALVNGAEDMSLFWRGHDWNDISSNINIDIFRTTTTIGSSNLNWPGRNDTFAVMIVGHNFDTEVGLPDTTPGVFGPHGNKFADGNEKNTSWQWGTIFLCITTYGLRSPNLLDRQALVIHEIGHALKLAHPNEQRYLFGQNSRNPDWRPLSVMNGGLPSSSNPNSFGGVTGYDRFNLRSAWR